MASRKSSRLKTIAKNVASAAKSVKGVKKAASKSKVKKINPRKQSFTTRELPIKSKRKLSELSIELEKNADKLDELLKPGEYIALEIGGKTEKGRNYVGRPAKVFKNFKQVAKHFQVDSLNFDKKKKRYKTLQEQKSLIDNVKFIKYHGEPEVYKESVLSIRRDKKREYKEKIKAEKKELKELRAYKKRREEEDKKGGKK